MLSIGCNAPTPTPTPSPSPAGPSATPSPSPSITSTPTPTVTPTPTFPVDAVVRVGGLNLRAGPDTLHPVLEVLGTGTPVALEGRSHDDRWAAARSPSDRRGWVSVQHLEFRRSLEALPTRPTPTSPPTRTPTAVPMPPSEPIVLVPPAVAQGEPLLVRVRTEAAIQVLAALDDREFQLHPAGPGIFAGMVATAPDTPPGQQPVFVTAIDGAGNVDARSAMLSIHHAGYGEETIAIDTEDDPARARSIDPEVRAAERERLRSLLDTPGGDRLWSGRWSPPVTPTITSPFGSNRSYNDGLFEGRHTGLDFRARAGVPVRAPARGRVIVAEPLDVLGRSVWLDHGWGVVSGYGHLSDIAVDPGQVVERGAMLGHIGASGAATGPHLHWEVRVGGVPTHPLRWLERDFTLLP